MSVRRPARVEGKPTVSGHLSEADLRPVDSMYATLRPAVNGSKLKQYELYEQLNMTLCKCTFVRLAYFLDSQPDY